MQRIGRPVLAGLGICAFCAGAFYVLRLINISWLDWAMQIFYASWLAFIAVLRMRERHYRIIVVLMVGTTLAAWLLAPNWLTASALALVTAIVILVLYQLRSAFASVALVLMLVAFCYDALVVFGTRWMLEEANQIAQAPDPRAVLAPAIVDSASQNVVTATEQWTAPPAALLGLGDIIVPGLLIVLAARLAHRLARPMIYWAAMGGFVFGFCVCVIVALVTASGQPALVYLVPGVVAGVYLAARKYDLQGNLHDRLIDIRCPNTEAQS